MVNVIPIIGSYKQIGWIISSKAIKQGTSYILQKPKHMHINRALSALLLFILHLMFARNDQMYRACLIPLCKASIFTSKRMNWAKY